MAEGFRFMPFGSVHGLLRCNINAGVHARTRSGCVTQRCHNSPDGKRGYRVRVTSHTRSARRIWGILKKSVRVELSPALGEDGWLSLARRGLEQVSHELGGGTDEKSQNRKNVYLSPYVEEPLNSKVIKSFIPELRKNVYLSPYVEEPLNSKVIKSFIPELRSRKCFSCFKIRMFYVYMLWTFYVHFTHIFIMGMVH